jgi:hypothetical protein
MDILQAFILVVLCAVIVMDVRLPPSFREIGLGPLTLLGVLILGYLFMNSPVLGIVGVVVLYSLIQPVHQELAPVMKDECPEEPAPLFKDTLEEEVIKSVPGVQFN